MKSVGHDIRITLIIKFLLLFILWWICFKDAPKQTVSTKQWLFSAPANINIDKPK